MKDQHSQLAVSIYIHALKKQIEKEVESRYTKRIDYLVGANNELMNELELYEEQEAVEKATNETTTNAG